ncbi:MAG: hypothetical protein AB1918_00350 [Pseudomonadota bacterium]
MGAPDGRDAGPLESLDALLHRLVDMVTGKDGHAPADDHGRTVEESVRRIETKAGPKAG